MTFGELLQLDPQHVAELGDFFTAFKFDDVGIAARDKVCVAGYSTPRTHFDDVLDTMKIDGVYRGNNSTHLLLQTKDRDYMEDDTFFCVSCAKSGAYEEYILFKLIRKLE